MTGTKDTHGTGRKGWIGVDLDGTLAVYHGWISSDHIGPPVPIMAFRVREWLKEGKDVRIFTARVCPNKPDAEICREVIHAWCFHHFGKPLTVTHEKDPAMLELWDDRAVQVIPNTGLRAAALLSRPVTWAMKALAMTLPKGGKLAQSLRCQFDLHDYCDWEDPTPLHMHQAPCVRCGTVFSI